MHTPGELSTRRSPSEAVDVVQAVTAGMKGVMDGVMEKFSELQGVGTTGDPLRPDRVQAISHMDFKTSAPTIRDDDPDLGTYDLKFNTMIECYSYGGKQPRDVDKLYKYAQGFKEGSTRKKVYELAFRKACRLKRIPHEAKAVLEEIQAQLRTFIWETKL